MAFLLKVLGSSATWEDTLLSETVESCIQFELESMKYEGRAGQSWGKQMDNIVQNDSILPTAEYIGIDDNALPFAASGFSEGIPKSWERKMHRILTSSSGL